MRTHWATRITMSVLPIAAVSVIANLATRPNIGSWYSGLAKPPLTPPNWLFGPVWTLLYVMMAIAAWRILSLRTGTEGRRPALAVFYLQLILNCLWSSVFFGTRNPAGGMAVIVLLLAAIVATIVVFWRLDRPAAWLLVPYAAWVSFATYLNLGFWRLNV